MGETYFRLVAVDDDQPFLHRLRMVLAGDQVEFIKGYTDPGTCLSEIHEIIPDVVLLNNEVNPVNGVDFVVRLRHQDEGRIKIIVLSSSPTHESVIMAMANGANGFIVKTGDHFENISKAIESVMAGNQFFSEGLICRDLFRQNRMSLSINCVELRARFGITARELDICRGLIDNQTTRADADRLGLSSETIKTHRSSIYRKLGVRDIKAARQIILSL